MAHMLIRAKFQDYAKFRSVFDARADLRKANGSKGAQVFRSAGDSNEVVVLMEWSDLGKAREFSQSEVLREGMAEAGLMDRPDVYFLEDGGKSSA